jgi:hypothetical protein
MGDNHHRLWKLSVGSTKLGPAEICDKNTRTFGTCWILPEVYQPIRNLVAAPLTDMAKKTPEFCWTPQTFEQIKYVMVRASVLGSS